MYSFACFENRSSWSCKCRTHWKNAGEHCSCTETSLAKQPSWRHVPLPKTSPKNGWPPTAGHRACSACSDNQEDWIWCTFTPFTTGNLQGYVLRIFSIFSTIFKDREIQMGAKLLVQLRAVHSAQSRKNLKLGNWSVTLLLVWDLLSSFEKVLHKNTGQSAQWSVLQWFFYLEIWRLVRNTYLYNKSEC